MKKLLAFFCVVGLCSSLSAINIFDFVSLEGNPKGYSQTDFEISSKFGNYFRTPEAKIVKSFDDNGNEVEALEYTARDVLVSKIVSSYDAYGNLLEQARYGADSELVWKSIFAYKDGKKSDLSEYDSNNNLKAKTIFTYKDGNLVDESGYNADGALMWKTIYTYNDNGNYNTICQYFADGSLDERLIFEYAEDGNIKNISCFSSIEAEQTNDVFRYANGKLSEITTYNSDKEVLKRFVIKYDSVGNVSKLSDYQVSQKFGTTVNELVSQTDFVFEY